MSLIDLLLLFLFSIWYLTSQLLGPLFQRTLMRVHKLCPTMSDLHALAQTLSGQAYKSLYQAIALPSETEMLLCD